MSVYLIAEAGASHGGDLSIAVDLIYSAKEAGADEALTKPFDKADLLAALKRLFPT